jgi:hypothetical protein
MDGLLEDVRPSTSTRRESKWILLGAFAGAMQVLAGHPQTVFRAGVAVVLYALLRLVAARRLTAKTRLRIAARVLLAYIFAIALAAVQILPGLELAGESSRQSGLSMEFAAMFSLPLENFVTLFVSDVFGNGTSVPYWGRHYLWEVTSYIGIVGLLLAGFGAWHALRTRRWVYLAMPLVLFVLALGAYTPLFSLLYHFVPGFNKFRVSAEFISPASLFLAFIAALGFDALLKNPPRLWILPGTTALLSAMFLAVGWEIQNAATNLKPTWVGLMQAVNATGQSYLPTQAYHDPAFLTRAGGLASAQVLIAGGLCLLVTLLFLASRRRPRALYGIALLVILEMTGFARSHRPTFDISTLRQPEVEAFFAAHPPNAKERVLNIANPNSASRFGAYDIWAYDPVILGRYAQFMAWTQHQNPDTAEMYVDFKHLHPLYRILRLHYVFLTENNEVKIGEYDKHPLPHLLLLDEYSVQRGRAAVFAAMNRKSFDPRREVILESEPNPRPQTGTTPGKVRLVGSSTDWLEIEADVPRPMILLVTDSYSKGWKAWGLSDSVQQEYSVLPANYVLRAIPLQAGHHHLRLEYLPRGFVVGKWISILALLTYTASLAYITMVSQRAKVGSQQA